ncbi:hypothetical protein [Shimazuella alba]|uniref:Spore coat protein n=1 Tax=Shimazuella alba TaxID=2690964 RepID=A0A6I4VQT5_9BACL|nr:hypothetical protein [Shimazuella alba]MXQ52761.1 hypothetical protein [Shimazuella alba]
MDLGMHEAIELHEVLTFKTLCTAKNRMTQGIVDDESLRRLITEDLERSSKHIDELKRFLVNPGGVQ